MSQVLSQVNPEDTFAATAARARSGVRPTILIAEDSKDARDMMEMLLRRKGYEVLSAENGVRAVEVALRTRPDLILLDLELPRLTGLGVVRILRSRPEFRNTPIIIVSGHDPASHQEAALAAGCTDYVLKPINLERLDIILKQNVLITG